MDADEAEQRLIAPLPENRNRNTSVVAMLLVTDGKKNAVRKKLRPLRNRLFSSTARNSARAVCSGTTNSTK